MAREFTITAAYVSDRVTARAGKKLLEWFSGYTRHDHLFGGYTYANGDMIEEPAVSWVIATDDNFPMVHVIVSEFARMYCLIGDQESIYFKALSGECFFVDGEGLHSVVK